MYTTKQREQIKSSTYFHMNISYVHVENLSRKELNSCEYLLGCQPAALYIIFMVP